MYRKQVYSRYTLIVHRSKVVNEMWERVKLLAPFGEDEHLTTIWRDLDVELEDVEEEQKADGASFDIQPKNNMSFQEDF
jgi:hypothetical protein